MTHQPPLSLSDLDDHELGQHLTRLGAELDLGDVDLVGFVSSAIERDERVQGSDGRSRMLLVAAAIVVVVAVLVILTPSRAAIANWLGIGSTSIEIVDELPPASTTPPPLAAPTAAAPIDNSTNTASVAPAGPDLSDESIVAATRAVFDLNVLLPDRSLAGEPVGWEIRDLAPSLQPATSASQELVVAWEDFTLSARSEESGFGATKATTASDLVSLSLMADGATALWVEGPHVRTIVGRSELAQSTLLWVRGGFEYRLSGELDRDEALALANSLR